MGVSKKTPKRAAAKVARVVVYAEKTPAGWKRITEARYRKLRPPRKRSKPREPTFIGDENEYWNGSHRDSCG